MKSVTNLFMVYKKHHFKPEHVCKRLSQITCAIYGTEIYNSYIEASDDVSRKVIIRTFNYLAYKETSDSVPEDVLTKFIEVCKLVVNNEELHNCFVYFHEFIREYVSNLNMLTSDSIPDDSTNVDCQEICSVFRLCTNDLFGIFCSHGFVMNPLDLPPSPSDVFVFPSKLPLVLSVDEHSIEEAASIMLLLKYAPLP